MVTFLLVFIGIVALILLIVIILIRIYLAIVTVTNVSMSPTLEHGDKVLVLRNWPTMWLRKGQIVLVWPSRSVPTRSTLFEVTSYIKRIVGLEGETLITSLNEEIKTGFPLQDISSNYQSQEVWYIPQKHVFVRGDNRLSSLDSLSWGPIPVENVLGIVLMRLPRKEPPLMYLPRVDKLPTIGLLIGQNAPPFTAQTLSGEIRTLASYSNQTVIFLFIAPSDICRYIIPKCMTLIAKKIETGLPLLFVSSTELQLTYVFVQELHINLPILIAPRANNSFFRDYNISMTPAYCCVSREGKVLSAGIIDVECEESNSLMDLSIDGV